MDRTKFYNKVNNDGVDELDFLDNPLSIFETTHTPSYYKTSEHDVARPDLISYNNYGTCDYWWIICIVNKIENPLTEIDVGDTLMIPNILDVINFYRRLSNR